jgi:hypothetical protein
MQEEKTTPLRQRMIEDMRIRGMGEKAQQAHIRAIKDFAIFLKRSPDTATQEELTLISPSDISIASMVSPSCAVKPVLRSCDILLVLPEPSQHVGQTNVH